MSASQFVEFRGDNVPPRELRFRSSWRFHGLAVFTSIGEPHCPRSGEPAPSRTASQILEAILALPEGTDIELRAPVFQQYGEELDFVLTEVRKKGCRLLIVDGKPVDISAQVELDESKIKDMDAVVDRYIASGVAYGAAQEFVLFFVGSDCTIHFREILQQTKSKLPPRQPKSGRTSWPSVPLYPRCRSPCVTPRSLNT